MQQKPKKVTRTRKKQQFKLRFHHQALPPEYLDHYEASQHNQQKREQQLQQQQMSGKKRTEINNDANINARNMTNESVKSWLQKITQLQQEGKSKVEEQDAEMTGFSTTANQKSSKVASYKDLPYMGEMTLENSKPRRGRKPKKADICHLIYKNYGTIFPDTPKQLIKDDANNEGAEKPSNGQTTKKQQNEPLNLCVRDTNDPFVVSSSDDEDDEENSLMSSEQTTPLMSPSDITMDTNLAINMKTSLQNIHSLLSDAPPTSTETSISDEISPKTSGDQGPTFSWPGSSSFMHPMALYYQKMVDSSLGVNVNDSKSSPKAQSPETPELKQRLVPKSMSKLMKEEITNPETSVCTSSTNTSNHLTAKGTQKRKRSAIFIPPLPAEPKSHATEVSICKFKFTGGAKPSLQEKKMLSVDSGGNFRYYSGTGDKSMRGYEFFPRESLALSSLTANTTTNAFLNATSEKIDLPPPSAGLSNDVLQIPEFPSTSVVSPLPASPIKLHPSSTHRSHHHHRLTSNSSSSASSDKRKRKSKRSVQRENLEKTFKEKGFLIQTQQTQSAEGATYCKFRQLRKFTRYLFRSWKDHLPGDVQGQFVNANGVPHCTIPVASPEIPTTL